MIAGHLMQRIVNTLSFDPHPNRTQMDSYVRSTNARCGIFIHSRSENPETWEERASKKNNKAIIWTCLIPGYSLDKQNNNNIQRIIDYQICKDA